MAWVWFVTVACIAPHISGAEVCCPVAGCFQNDGPFSHFPEPACVESYGMQFRLHTRSNDDDPQSLSRTSAIPPAFCNSRRTIFVIHGYKDSIDVSYMRAIKDALLSMEDANVFLVGWQAGAGDRWFPQAAANTRTAGAEVALMMDKLGAQAGLPSTRRWCIGFSLGAHACGFAGYRTNIQRVTGLDPTGPGFDRDERARLNPGAGTLVDVVHTDGGHGFPGQGQLVPMGHMDFYPNRGRDQPGCLTTLTPDTVRERISNSNFTELKAGFYGDETDVLFCNHMRAVTYFDQSIKKGCFAVRQICEDENKLPSSCTTCSGGICGEMGYFADNYRTHGKFYLDTYSLESDVCGY